MNEESIADLRDLHNFADVSYFYAAGVCMI